MDEYCPRRLAAEVRIFQHGLIPWAFAPGATTEQLEQIANELDAAVPERVY